MAHYDSYILRIWRSISPTGAQWAARLEHMQHGESTQFASMEVLLAHLRHIAGPLPTPRDEESGEPVPEGREHGDDTL
jgi:hypothetical protein